VLLKGGKPFQKGRAGGNTPPNGLCKSNNLEILSRVWERVIRADRSRIDLTIDHTVILNDTSQPEGCTAANPLYADCLNLTAQAETLVVGSMGRHDNVALDALSGIDRMPQQAIKPMLVDVFSARADWLPEASAFQIHGPMKLQPGASPPFDDSHTGSVEGNHGRTLYNAHRSKNTASVARFGP
jgi:hypothetical protein